MSNYRRLYQPGNYYFFTIVTHQRQPLFSNPENINKFKTSLNKVKTKYKFSLNAIVILPDHLHCIWKLPNNDINFSNRWRLIKRYFSLEMEARINSRKEKEIWQRRYWEHWIRDVNDWKNHMDYIHYNPVKHNLVKSPCDWKHSSFDFWVDKGIYDKCWSANSNVFEKMNVGE